MSKVTPATRALAAAGVAFTVHTYDYDPDAESIGLQAASALGENPCARAEDADGAGGRQADLRRRPVRPGSLHEKLAAAASGKSAQMMKPPEAERVTGYKVGGISPFGQRKPVRTVIEQSALAHDQVYLNGGQRGLQVRLKPGDVRDVLKAVVADVVA